MHVSRLKVAGAMVCAMAMLSSPAFAQDEDRGIDPNQGENLVEVVLPSKAAALRLQLEAETYGVEFNDHYLRDNGDGSVAVSVFGSENEIQALADAGYEVGLTIEGPKTWRKQADSRETAIRKESRASGAAVGKPGPTPDPDAELVVLRADYFENYGGRFLSVEAKTRLATVNPANGAYTGPTLSLSWNEGDGTAISATPRTMTSTSTPTRRPTPTSSIASSSASAAPTAPTRPRRRPGSGSARAAPR